MRDLYDVMAKEPVWKSDKTDSGKPDTGKQAFLQGLVQPIYQPVRCKHRLREQLPPRARSRLLAHCWLAGMVGVSREWKASGTLSSSSLPGWASISVFQQLLCKQQLNGSRTALCSAALPDPPDLQTPNPPFL